jgi:REP element-mobilizing transposase RayT
VPCFARRSTIDGANCKELYQYISGIVKNKNAGCMPLMGTEDLIHIFSDLHPLVDLSDYVKDIKIASSGRMKANSRFPEFEAWQEEYGASTYSVREKDMIIDYIKNQKEHHRKGTFHDELKRLLIENEIEFEEKYLL